MNRLITPLILCAALCGCAGSPTTQWYKAREGLSVVQDGIVSAYNQHVITPNQVPALKTMDDAAHAALDDAHKWLPGGGTAFDNDLTLVKSATDNINKITKVK